MARTRKTKVSAKTIVPFISPNPIGVERVIADIQEALTGITWIEKSFGRAVEMSKVNQEGVTEVYPKLWVEGGKDELKAIGLDYWSAYTFMVAGDEVVLDDTDDMAIHESRPLSLYVWANADKVEKGHTYDIREKLKSEVTRTIKSPFFKDGATVRILGSEQDHTDVYAGYTYDVSAKNVHHPYIIFRIDMEASYYVSDCLDE